VTADPLGLLGVDRTAAAPAVSKAWATKTPDEILADIQKVIEDVLRDNGKTYSEVTEQIHFPPLVFDGVTPVPGCTLFEGGRYRAEHTIRCGDLTIAEGARLRMGRYCLYITGRARVLGRLVGWYVKPRRAQIRAARRARKQRRGWA
jgi:hypothetical protein